MVDKQKIRDLPLQPGVYIMRDSGGNIIYIGKAKILKNRVSQYFNNSPKPVKVQAMVSNIADFEYIITLSESDALALEANLIKKHQPYYNILLKDDKNRVTTLIYPCLTTWASAGTAYPDAVMGVPIAV